MSEHTRTSRWWRLRPPAGGLDGHRGERDRPATRGDRYLRTRRGRWQALVIALAAVLTTGVAAIPSSSAAVTPVDADLDVSAIEFSASPFGTDEWLAIFTVSNHGPSDVGTPGGDTLIYSVEYRWEGDLRLDTGSFPSCRSTGIRSCVQDHISQLPATDCVYNGGNRCITTKLLYLRGELGNDEAISARIIHSDDIYIDRGPGNEVDVLTIPDNL